MVHDVISTFQERPPKWLLTSFLLEIGFKRTRQLAFLASHICNLNLTFRFTFLKHSWDSKLTQICQNKMPSWILMESKVSTLSLRLVSIESQVNLRLGRIVGRLYSILYSLARRVAERASTSMVCTITTFLMRGSPCVPAMHVFQHACTPVTHDVTGRLA